MIFQQLSVPVDNNAFRCHQTGEDMSHFKSDDRIGLASGATRAVSYHVIPLILVFG